MQTLSLLSVLLTVLLHLVSAQSTSIPVTGTLGNASVVENNPPGVTYTATLPEREFNNPNDARGNIKGLVSAVANPNGIGVSFKINFSNLPTSGGPFLYHIHAFPVPSSGNCTETLGHLDPYERGETPACNGSLPQTCQVGDLSGKHGLITSDPFTASYTDDFASTEPGIGAFFGNRSIAVHFNNKTRITCANWTLASTSSGNSSANATSTGSPTRFTGAAAGKNVVSVMGLLALTGAMFLL